MSPALQALANLDQFSATVDSWRTDDTLTIPRSAQSRFIVHCQSNTAGWAALARDEALEEAGLDSLELDSAQFADALATRMGHHLSILDLEALIPRLQAELTARQAERVQALSVLQRILQPAKP